MAETLNSKKFKINDRVKRNQLSGCLGTVREIRIESSASTQAQRERGILVCVQWDNGTVSFFSPESLDLV